jgi:CRP-like cAMP-binding protein
MPRTTPPDAPGADHRAAGSPTALRALLERYVPLPDAEWDRFAAALRPRRLRRGAHLVRAGERVDTLSFVVAGVLRRYAVVEGGEVTTGFLVEHSFATDYPALCAGDHSESNLQALTEVRVLSADAAALRRLAGADAGGRAFAAAAGVALARRRERRHIAMLSDTHRPRAALPRGVVPRDHPGESEPAPAAVRVPGARRRSGLAVAGGADPPPS